VTEDLSFLGRQSPDGANPPANPAIAPVDVPVFICGGGAWGKSGCAISTCARSGETAFVKVNCAALPGELLESNFSDSSRAHSRERCAATRQVLNMANKGTIFLDEIAEMRHALTGETTSRAAGSSVFAAGGRPPGGDRRARAGRNKRGCT